MDLEKITQNWQRLGQEDPLWAVLSWPGKKGGKWDAEEFFKTGRGEITAVLGYLDGLKLAVARDSALDFGCGAGRLTQALAEHFTRVVGVDAAPAMISLAKTLDPAKKCSFVLNQAGDLKIFPDSSFSFIYSRLTLQHLPPEYAKGYIREFIRILKPGGVAVFVQPYKRRCNSGALSGVSIKQALRMIIPVGVQNFFRRCTGAILGRPVMELYSLDKQSILNLLRERQARIINIDEFGDLGPAWACYRYCVINARRGEPKRIRPLYLF